jgi:hypothetical protein
MTSVVETLQKYGGDKGVAAQASSAALRGYLTELDNWLSDIASIDELETYERELKTVMNDYGVTDNMVAYRIECRRDELFERSDDKRKVTGWTPTAVPGDMSDKDISLFESLDMSDEDIISSFQALRDE